MTTKTAPDVKHLPPQIEDIDDIRDQDLLSTVRIYNTLVSRQQASFFPADLAPAVPSLPTCLRHLVQGSLL
jgi:hypothetical protein